MKEAMPVKATMITISRETKPAWTAAWPMTRAPTMLMAVYRAGELIPASATLQRSFHNQGFSTAGVPFPVGYDANQG